jgi:DNA-binding transcriptional LysR family regulator
MAACLAGLGIIQVPVAGSQRLVDAGLLVDVMPGFRAAPMPVSLLYPHRRQVPPRVQTVLNWVANVIEAYLRESQPGERRKLA